MASDAQALRTAVAGISVQGRAPVGVAGMKLRPGARLVAAGPATADGVGRHRDRGRRAQGHRQRGRAPPGPGHRAASASPGLRAEDGGLRQATVAPVAQLWCVMGQDDDPARPDPQPQPLPSEPTRRDATSARTARRVLAVGKARW